MRVLPTNAFDSIPAVGKFKLHLFVIPETERGLQRQAAVRLKVPMDKFKLLVGIRFAPQAIFDLARYVSDLT